MRRSRRRTCTGGFLRSVGLLMLYRSPAVYIHATVGPSKQWVSQGLPGVVLCGYQHRPMRDYSARWIFVTGTRHRCYKQPGMSRPSARARFPSQRCSTWGCRPLQETTLIRSLRNIPNDEKNIVDCSAFPGHFLFLVLLSCTRRVRLHHAKDEIISVPCTLKLPTRGTRLRYCIFSEYRTMTLLTSTINATSASHSESKTHLTHLTITVTNFKSPHDSRVLYPQALMAIAQKKTPS